MKEQKCNYKIICIILVAIIIIVFLISLSAFFIVNVCNDKTELTFGKYVNDECVFIINEKSLMLLYNGTSIKLKIDSIIENIIIVSNDDMEDYVLIYDNKTLYLNWCKQYVYLVK